LAVGKAEFHEALIKTQVGLVELGLLILFGRRGAPPYLFRLV
jgi:hypothetical protein